MENIKLVQDVKKVLLEVFEWNHGPDSILCKDFGEILHEIRWNDVKFNDNVKSTSNIYRNLPLSFASPALRGNIPHEWDKSLDESTQAPTPGH